MFNFKHAVKVGYLHRNYRTELKIYNLGKINTILFIMILYGV